MERETGLEPATLSLEGWCSSQLSYSRKAWWWVVDSNHGRRKPADLQSALVGHLSNSPWKMCFYSGQTLLKWSWLRDLNPRPAAYKAAALPTELNQQTFKNKLGLYLKFYILSRLFWHFNQLILILLFLL